MRRLLWVIFVVSLCLAFGASAAFAQTPSEPELEDIVFQVESPVNINEASAAEPHTWLEVEVAEFMDVGRLAPLYVKMGFRPIQGWKAFAEPAETFYALSLAYPYLSPALQTRVREFLAQEFSDFPPYQVARYPMDGPGFARRELADLPSDKRSTEGQEIREGHMISRLYPLWAYAYYTDNWNAVLSEWEEIKGIFNSFVGTYNVAPQSEDENLNRYLSGLIGYIRIAHQLGDDSEVGRGLGELARLVPNRLANARWRGDQAARFLDEYGCDSFGRCPGAGMFIIGRNTAPKLYQFWDFTPELARLLQNYAPDAMQSSINYVNRNLSGWYIANGELTVSAGDFFLENRIDYPHVSLQFFQLMAFIDRPGGDKLKLYASAPISKGDLYHIQKLVHVIQGYGTLCYEDLRTPQRECSDEGKSVSPSTANEGDVVTYTIYVLGTGQPVSVTDPLPGELAYVPNSASVTPDVGVLSVDGNAVLRWTGTLTEDEPLEITFQATVVAAEPLVIWNTAYADYGDSTGEWSAFLLANGYDSYLPDASNGASAPETEHGIAVTGPPSMTPTTPASPTPFTAASVGAEPKITVVPSGPRFQSELVARTALFLTSLLVMVGRLFGIQVDWVREALPWLR